MPFGEIYSLVHEQTIGLDAMLEKITGCTIDYWGLSLGLLSRAKEHMAVAKKALAQLA